MFEAILNGWNAFLRITDINGPHIHNNERLEQRLRTFAKNARAERWSRRRDAIATRKHDILFIFLCLMCAVLFGGMFSWRMNGLIRSIRADTQHINQALDTMFQSRRESTEIIINTHEHLSNDIKKMHEQSMETLERLEEINRALDKSQGRSLNK
jgi:hypothetical protein